MIRCISVEKKPVWLLRRELQEWLDLLHPSRSASPHPGRRVNLQNRRLALMALHAVGDLANSEFGRTYRLLLE